jgi:hypothetical protein
VRTYSVPRVDVKGRPKVLANWEREGRWSGLGSVAGKSESRMRKGNGVAADRVD